MRRSFVGLKLFSFFSFSSLSFFSSLFPSFFAFLFFLLRYYIVALLLVLFSSPLMASSFDSLPWDTPGQRIEGWLTGSVAKMVAIILIAISGIMFANGEHGSAFRRMMGVVFGISIAVGAVSIYASLGFSGAEV